MFCYSKPMTSDNPDQLKPIEAPHIIRSGRLLVGDGHELYWIDWGNRDVKNPIFYLHGGPGGGFTERDFDKFDPSRHRVVFHDQRGSGRSTPFASTKNNTTADLLSDINKLKQHLNFETISLYGNSWGSTLSLLYAIANPDAVDKMLVAGIFLARAADVDFYLKGRVASHFPEAWEQFADQVPKGQNIADYYQAKMSDSDQEQRRAFAKRWMMYESSLLSLDYVPAAIERNLADFAAESLAYLEAHYLLNGCFIPENYILDNASKLGALQKIVIVHGRYDFICEPKAAYDLRQALSDNALLHFVASGHASGDTVKREVMQAYTNLLW
jgi:proline iminopeptidase